LTYAVEPMRVLMLEGFVPEKVLPGFLILALLAAISAGVSIRMFNRSFG
jgi:hypothetical protein